MGTARFTAVARVVLDAAEASSIACPRCTRASSAQPAVGLCRTTACRLAAVAAAGAVHLLLALAGIRPDAPEALVAVRPMTSAPLGAVRLTGLSVAGRLFGLRVSRLGMAMIEKAAPGLQLAA